MRNESNCMNPIAQIDGYDLKGRVLTLTPGMEKTVIIIIETTDRECNVEQTADMYITLCI